MTREGFGSRLGFILLSAGCAIGLGSIWKFPYMVGLYGGGAFVLLFLLFLCLFGIPLLCIEQSLGRASRSSPLRMYGRLAPEGTKWHNMGYLCMAGTFLLMAFYVVVTAWLLIYLFQNLAGAFEGLDPSGVSNMFHHITEDPLINLAMVAVVVVLGFAICSMGVQKGLERITKPMMLLMLFIMVFLAIYALTMPGAMEGLAFYLVPDFDRMMENGLWNAVMAALSQAFFTLSVGMGSMAMVASYSDKGHSILGEASRVAALNVFVAIMAGVIIFPACFTYHVDVNSGPSLIFETLPNVFIDMAYGEVVGAFFFLFMSFAALSTVFTVFESLVSNVMELTGWSRRRTCAFNCLLMFILVVPCALGFGLLSGFEPFGPGTTVMDLEDYVLSFIILPFGAIVSLIFCISKRGWGWDAFMEEANTGEGPKLRGWVKHYLAFIVMPVVLLILVAGLLT